jgi:hypothetical protein
MTRKNEPLITLITLIHDQSPFSSYQRRSSLSAAKALPLFLSADNSSAAKEKK